MIRSFRLPLFLLLLALAMPGRAEAESGCPPAAAQPTSEQVQAARRVARDHGFLWRISKDGRSSFLYGTIHVAKLDWLMPGPVVMQALAASDTIALELDLLDPQIRAAMARGVAALPKVTLPEPLASRIRRQGESECLAGAEFDTLPAEMQVMTLTMIAGRRDGIDPAYGTDVVLAAAGHAAGKSVVSLETPEAQLAVLHAGDAAETEAFVAGTLDDLEAGRARRMIGRLAAGWAASDYEGMAGYADWCECLNSDAERATMKRVLDDRNPGLAERIDGLHAGGKRVFAAVGSLHLFGPLGLPALMAQRGYRVERVDLARF